MPINRAPYDALIDDDGSGLTGSIWNKAAIKSVILDPADAAYAQGPGSLYMPRGNALQSTSLSGSQVIALTTGGVDTLLICGQGAPLTITGMTGGVIGQYVTILNSTGFPVSLANGTGPDQLYNFVMSVPTVLATRGKAVYVNTGGLWYLISHTQGEWIDVPFNVANFWPGMTAGMILSNRYMVTGKLAVWLLQLNGAVAPSPASAYMYCAVPTGNGSLGLVLSPVASCIDNGAFVTAQVFTGNANLAAIAKVQGGNWTASIGLVVTMHLALN